MQDDICTKCKLLLRKHLIHYCDHCKKPYCFPHLQEHDKELEHLRSIAKLKVH